MIDLTCGETVRMEALARWPGAGPLVGPEKFVRAAERTGWVAEFDLHVLGLVAEQVARWTQAGLRPAVSVNFATATFEDERNVQHAVDILQNFAVDPSSISLEVTATSQVETSSVRQTLDKFRDAGFRISIDDFGTHDSLFEQLRSTTADELKIDREFIAQLSDSRVSTIVGSIIELAHTLGVAVVAEGVETEHEVSCLIDLECDLAQGRWFSPPVAAHDAFGLFAVKHELPVS